jgi:hypothetical protein
MHRQARIEQVLTITTFSWFSFYVGEDLLQVSPLKYCHPVYDDNGLSQVKKSARRLWRWKRSQGRPLLAFISTLDGVSSAPTIEPGWKRSAFAFS